jgi:hypothetical protein
VAAGRRRTPTSKTSLTPQRLLSGPGRGGAREAAGLDRPANTGMLDG